jgi:hypothetical protein
MEELIMKKSDIIEIIEVILFGITIIISIKGIILNSDILMIVGWVTLGFGWILDYISHVFRSRGD